MGDGPWIQQQESIADLCLGSVAWWEQKRVRSGAESERAQGEGGRGEFAGDGHSGGCVNSTAKKNTATNIYR